MKVRLYDMLVEVAMTLRDTKPTKGETILKAREQVDDILAAVNADISEGEVYCPGYSIVIDEDEEDEREEG